MTKRVSGHYERTKQEAGEGFDTPGRILKTIAKIAIPIAIALIIAIVVYTYIANPETGIGGGQRNCILSVMGNPPDCSDNDGTLKTTYANGKYVGECYGLDNSGKCIQ
ncbi:MAG TPA: hypothetical protein VJ438_04120 [Candidatus Nanoarchaeia archaeon]|nr:hypothetical protein [Candidatus Nanoarchaeia archaeon]